MAEQVRQICSRLCLSSHVVDKAMEFVRLAAVRSTGVKSMQLSCLVAVCIDAACSQLGEPVDKKQLQRFSGVRGRDYTTAYQTVGKLLGISQITLGDLAVRLGCVEAKEAAKKVLLSYKKQISSKYTTIQLEAINLSQVLYSSAALYSACRSLKIRCDKLKFLNAAQVSRNVFQKVLEELQQCVPMNTMLQKPRHTRQTDKSDSKHMEDEMEVEDAEGNEADMMDSPLHTGRESLQMRVLSSPLDPEYLSWKERIISSARQQLQTGKPGPWQDLHAYIVPNSAQHKQASVLLVSQYISSPV